MKKLPANFNQYGLLPIGDHESSFASLKKSILVEGPKTKISGWDSAWRLELVNNSEKLVHELWEIGVSEIYLSGSFVEDKIHPNDIDGYFVCDAQSFGRGEIERNLNLLNPYKIWTWDPDTRRFDRMTGKKQLPMWHKYRVELYAHYDNRFSGITDKFGNELTFPSAFRKTRYDDRPKGVVKLVNS